MSEFILTLFWVAAHHGLRRRPVRRGDDDELAWQRRQWERVRAITNALGNPPAPRGP